MSAEHVCYRRAILGGDFGSRWANGADGDVVRGGHGALLVNDEGSVA